MFHQASKQASTVHPLKGISIDDSTQLSQASWSTKRGDIIHRTTKQYTHIHTVVNDTQHGGIFHNPTTILLVVSMDHEPVVAGRERDDGNDNGNKWNGNGDEQPLQTNQYRFWVVDGRFTKSIQTCQKSIVSKSMSSIRISKDLQHYDCRSIDANQTSSTGPLALYDSTISTSNAGVFYTPS